MASTNSGIAILNQAVRKGDLGKVIPAANIDALVAGSFTSALFLRNGNHSSDHWRSQNAGVYRPGAASAADYWRVAGALTASSGLLAVDANWADTTSTSETFYLLKNGLHPVEIVDALNHAMKRCYFPCNEPLSSKPIGTNPADAGFQSTATTSYTLTGSGTFTKVSTANSENTYAGMISSGFLDSGAAGDYISQQYDVEEGEQIVDFVLSRVAAGTGGMQHILRDVTNTASIGTTVEHLEEAWMWTRRIEAVPEGCKTVEWRGSAKGASDDVYFNAHIFYRTQGRRIILDTTWEATEFEIPSLYWVDLRRSGTSNGVWDANAVHLEPIPRDLYDFGDFPVGANPGYIQFHADGMFDRPIWIDGRRAYSDLTTFSLALSETTSCDLDLIESALRVQLFQAGGPCAHWPDAQQKWSAAVEDFRDANRQRVRTGPAPTRNLIIVRGSRN